MIRIVAVGLLLLFAMPLFAPAQERLIDQEPFDQIELDAANGKVVLKTQPLELPNRRVPLSPAPSSKLRLRLVDRPKKLYECEWQHIVEVRLFENMVQVEAEQLAADGNFDEAFEYFDYLLKNFPKLPGLNVSIDTFLYKNALAALKSNKNDESLCLLVAIAERNRERKGLDKAFELVAASVVTERIKQERYDAARGVFKLLAEMLPEVPMPRVDRLRDQMLAQATELRDDARNLLATKQLRKAQLASHKALAVWPDLEGVRELAVEIDTKYPLVMVGVVQAAGPASTHPFGDWASRRVTRLLARPLVEMTGFTAEGGEYQSPIGNLARDESGVRMSIQVRPGIVSDNGEPLTGYDISRGLLVLADGPRRGAVTTWDDLFRGATVEQVFKVQMDLARPLVRPERILQSAEFAAFRWNAPQVGAATPRIDSLMAPYRVESVPGENRFAANPRYFGYDTSQPQELIEKTYRDSDVALKALRRGEIDVLDRICPWDVGLLDGNDTVVTEPYLLPTVHVLVPNLRRPIPANRTFRRAILYAINRQAILDQVILGGRTQAGSMVVSGPFAASASMDDPVGYGSDDLIKPAVHEPRMAVALLAIALKELSPNEKPGTAPQQQEPLVITYPAEPISRLACVTIAERLSPLGITTQLREFMPSIEGPGEDYDFLYCELAAWEPVVDARRILGEHGLAGGCSPYMSVALAKLDQAETWKEVRRRLREVHRIAADELAVIPLWQTVNHFAYRRGAVDVGKQLVDLYQNVEVWKARQPVAVR